MANQKYIFRGDRSGVFYGEMGRKAFAAAHGVDMSATSTVEEFIELTRNAYGGSVIKQLAERYKGG